MADDFGRFEADPRVILARCFPLRVNSMPLKKIAVMFADVCKCKLVRTYVSNGKMYGFFITWDKYQKKRAKQSKYPEPTSENICKHMLANVPEKREARNEESRSEKREANSEQSEEEKSLSLFFGEFRNVRLSQGEYDKLVEKLGKKETEGWIVDLDMWLGKPKNKEKVSSHYLTILDWNRREQKKQAAETSYGVEPF